MRILVVRLSALGDVVMGLSVLSTLRARFGSAHIGWLVEDRFAPILEGHPQIDRLHVYDRKVIRRISGWPRAIDLAKELRAENYDIALDFQGNLKSGVLTRLSGAPRRVGLKPPHSREGNHRFMTESVAILAGHRFAGYREVLDHVFGPGSEAPALLPAQPEGDGEILFHPGVSGFGAYKRWPAAHFAALGDRLAQALGRGVTLTAGPGERGQAEAVRELMQGDARIVEPDSLKALVNTLAGAHIVVAADTGPAHIAAATGVPTLTLFGPKDPAVMAPLGKHTRAVRAGVRCSPCPLRACPDPICMSELSVDAVEAEALALLAEATRT